MSAQVDVETPRRIHGLHVESQMEVQRTASTLSLGSRNLISGALPPTGMHQEGDFARELTVTDRIVHLPTAAELLSEEANALNEYRDNLERQGRRVHEAESRHWERIKYATNEMQQRFSTGQEVDRRILMNEIEEVQSFYARQGQEHTLHLQNVMQSEVTTWRGIEHCAMDQMRTIEQKCAFEVTAIRSTAHNE